MTAPDAPPAAPASAAPKPQLTAALEGPSATEANAAEPSGAAAQWIAPVPPHRPSEFMGPDIGLAYAPTPPARPVEFASLQAAANPSASVADASRKSDLIAALLARNLPGVITRGADGAIPASALALTETPPPSGRPASLAKAAALSAVLPAAGPQLLSPLARAGLLSAPLPPNRPPAKPLLVAARIDRSNFGLMTAAPSRTQSQANAAARIVPVAPVARPDMNLAMMWTPSALTPASFARQPYGDLRSDAFTGPAVKPLTEAAPAGDVADLRGSTN
jgi:hypothetical protein